MATVNAMTPQDCYALMNSLVQQSTGRTDLVATDTSSFVSVGTTLLKTAPDALMSALSIMWANTIFSQRAYTGKLKTLRRSDEQYGAVTRKIIQYPLDLVESKDLNTDLNPSQLANGESVDMYTINGRKAVQINFYGETAMQYSETYWLHQLRAAMRDESEMAMFNQQKITELRNDFETIAENESRMVLLNRIAGQSSMGLYEVDLAKEFNTEYGTSYTRAQLLSTYLTEFMQFVASQIKIYSDNMTDRSGMYHFNFSDGTILHHTPKEYQRMIMYSPIFTKTKASVYSALFNPQYLDIGDFEGVNYWQSKETPEQIKITPSILKSDGTVAAAEAEVDLPFVLGILFDVEAMGINFTYDQAATTPINTKGLYYNTDYHFLRKYWNDYTENAIVFVIGEGS